MRDHKSLLAWQEARAVVRLVMAATRRCRPPYSVVTSFSEQPCQCSSILLRDMPSDHLGDSEITWTLRTPLPWKRASY
jgi:hypothetical protein